ncbi:hypothetical protein L1987_07078 [Smallanthus sonchifolius]|uniref:Uncharacterized protein n=1 Tax=Smallanthus sonchifolius TaxID=185202 RepID=A0ACB9K027_9ASTR|nr:hypothetical protein L1987_07078 [Smallanthus sonchifolius]
MSYKMISQKTKDGLDATKHVTRMRAFTRFIDEPVPDPPKMEGDDETKAIEKAQESIRIAKESVGRKKRGLQSFSNAKFKNSFKVETNVEDVTSSQAFPNFMDEGYKGKIEVVKTATNVLNVEEEQEPVERVEVDQLSESKGNGHESVKESNDFNMSQKEEFDDSVAIETDSKQGSQYSDNEDETEEHRPSKVSSQDHFRRIYEEAAAKEKERVKGRLAVERSICEARDRAFAEARERAERQRAAVEEAIEEARQRMMTEAREATKASAASKSSSAQSKLKAERAVVERATSEARQRALEKAMSQKIVSANALAEKEKRDRLAQKEQAERNVTIII